ncbi:MAG: dihydroneopterin aldolase [Fimbriimonadales bacterium]|nr:dihydroneopterin aldolase [Fimbriimonadales bacterium]
MDRLFIEGIEFYGYHGVPDAEQQIGHRYRVDVTLELDLSRAGRTDQLEYTVDYGKVVRLVIQLGTEQQVRLMETLAERLCAAILEQFPLVQRVQVRVAKRLPPTGAIVELAGVEIRRERAVNGED